MSEDPPVLDYIAVSQQLAHIRLRLNAVKERVLQLRQKRISKETKPKRGTYYDSKTLWHKIPLPIAVPSHTRQQMQELFGPNSEANQAWGYWPLKEQAKDVINIEIKEKFVPEIPNKISTDRNEDQKADYIRDVSLASACNGDAYYQIDETETTLKSDDFNMKDLLLPFLDLPTPFFTHEIFDGTQVIVSGSEAIATVDDIMKAKQKGKVSLSDMPVEIQGHIIFFLQQEDLIQTCLVNQIFYQLSIAVLYRRIYLNDSYIKKSRIDHLYRLASAWTWFKLDPVCGLEASKYEANDKLELLVRSLEENLDLTCQIYEIRLNWDLEITLQLNLLKVVSRNSTSIRIIDSITDPRLNLIGLKGSRYSQNLLSLDLPPPFSVPSTEMPKDVFFNDMSAYLSSNLSLNLRHLTLFIDPLLVFNNITRPKFKLELESFKYHCRPDAYPNWIYNKNDWEYFKISELFDTKYLKNLTIISWYDVMPSRDIFRYDDWTEFYQLQDITFISVVFDDKAISEIIRSCTALKRLKLDFGQLIVLESTMIYQAIISPQVQANLEFLDMKISITNKVIDFRPESSIIDANMTCMCERCRKTYLEILKGKIIPEGRDFYLKGGREFYLNVNFFLVFMEAALMPYSKAVDKYPSVRTSDDTIQQFVNDFNRANSGRPEFISITIPDFYRLFEYFIHSWKHDLEPFIKLFDKLKFLVVNDISMIVVKNKEGKKQPLPFYHNRDFVSNFGL